MCILKHTRVLGSSSFVFCILARYLEMSLLPFFICILFKILGGINVQLGVVDAFNDFDCRLMQIKRPPVRRLKDDYLFFFLHIATVYYCLHK